MSEAMDHTDFAQNMREGEYTALINVSGTISISIKAESQEDAQRQAMAEVERIEKERYAELDQIDDIELGHVRKDRPMFLVTRDGRAMQVSHLAPGDLPREPDERGF
jgi:hypothetical protein